jgi:cell division protein FtsB
MTPRSEWPNEFFTVTAAAQDEQQEIVALRARIAELEAALMDIKHLTDPIIERARRALEKKP